MATALAQALERSPRTKRERYEQIRSSLWLDRQNGFDAHWRELGDYLLPRRTRFWTGDRNKGGSRNQNIIDSTGRFAARTLSSGMHAGLTSPARPWFKLTTPDPDLRENKQVKDWLHVVSDRMQVVFASTNLYNALPVVYGDMGTFGTAAMAVLEDQDDLLRCYTYPIGSYALGMDRRGKVTSFVRDYELTVLQVVEEFGVRPGMTSIDWSRISTTVQDAWDKGDYQRPVELTWVICPNLERQPRALGYQRFKWVSCHYERGDQQSAAGARLDVLRESGFDTFPILAPRWDVTGEDTYGTDCPGMTALGDVKQLQIMQKEKGKAIKKMVDPPMVGEPELRTQKTSLLPGDITYVRNTQYGLRAAHSVELKLSELREDMNDVRYRIQRAYFEDLFLMLAQADTRPGAGVQPITAREVEERHEEKLLALGPVVERTDDELLDPLIDRTFALMHRGGLLPDPPEILQGVKLQVEYTSLLAQAQKLVGVVGQDRFMASISPMVEAFPSLRHKVNANHVINNYAEMLGVDPRIIRSDEEAEQLQAAEAEAARAQATAEQTALMAKGLKDASQAPMGTGSALDRLVEASAPQEA